MAEIFTFGFPKYKQLDVLFPSQDSPTLLLKELVYADLRIILLHRKLL